MKKRPLLIKQLDRQLQDVAVIKSCSRPPEGWVRTIRKALGMTVKQLAGRLSLHPSRVTRIESDELTDALTLRTLKHVANAMNCELHYVLLPKKTLISTIKSQAASVAKRKIASTHHSMLLEDQGVDEQVLADQLSSLIDSLLEGNPKHIWEDEK